MCGFRWTFLGERAARAASGDCGRGVVTCRCAVVLPHSSDFGSTARIGGVTCLWTWWRTAIRARRGSTLVLIAFTGLAFGAALAALAGARRTDTAVGRLLDATNANDAVFSGEERFFSSIERLPQVASSHERVFLPVAPTEPATPNGRAPMWRRWRLSEPGTPHGVPWALVVDGRFADPSRADQVVVNESTASHLGLHVGSQMSFASFGPDQLHRPGRRTKLLIRAISETRGLSRTCSPEHVRADWPTSCRE